MPTASVAGGHQERFALGEPEKLLINMVLMNDGATPGRDVVLRRLPGTIDADPNNGVSGTIRGLDRSDGFAGGDILVTDGNTVRRYNTSSQALTAIAGGVAGSDRTMWAIAETQAALLAGGRIYLANADATELRDITDGMRSASGVSQGSTASSVAHGALSFRIDGTNYTKVANAVGVDPGTDVVPQSKYGAVALDINASGTVSVVSATSNATGYDSATAAISGIPAAAIDKVRIGTVTVTKSDGAFTFGTTNLDATNVTAAFSDGVVNTGFTDQLEDIGETVFTSITTIGQRLVFSYGERFGFSDALNFGSTFSLSYYTSEQRPDKVVMVASLGSQLAIVGTEITEFWNRQISNTDPFFLSVGQELGIGCLSRDTVSKVERTLVMLCHDSSVRMISGGQDQAITKEWLVDKVRQEDPATLWGYIEQWGNDHQYVLGSGKWCYAFKLGAGDWAQRRNYNVDTWRWQHVVRDGRNIYYGGGSRFGLQSASTYTDYDDFLPGEFTAHIAGLSRGQDIGPLVLDCATGVGIEAGQGSEPIVQARISVDEGHNFGPWIDIPLGELGAYDTRVVLYRCGISLGRDIVVHYRVTDPVHMMVKGVIYQEAA